MTTPLYEIRNLVYSIGKKQVLTINNFEIHRGIIYTISGQPGSGKTSLMELLAGEKRPAGGSISYEGESLLSPAVRRRYAKEFFYLPQKPGRGRGDVSRYMLRHIRTASWSNESAEERLQRVVKQMNLGSTPNRKLQTLSPGERRKIEIAVSVASDTRVLMIDELEQHLSYDDLESVKRLLQRKCTHEGTTVIVTTLSPMTIRKMTGVSVTLDRGRISMIRSVRDSFRPRRSDNRGRGNGRPRQRGSGSRSSEKKNGKE